VTDSRYRPTPYVRISHPEWSKNATIYQINTRQFTAEGTFRAAEAHLPRLADLGADILWIMPIHPIGEVNRKGSLGSPYAVKDYLGVNPEFGTLEDFTHFVSEAHAHGFHVILDWVANHTAWDNPLVTEHPEWYLQDWKGDFCLTPWWDWDDIIDFEYSSPELREYMTDALTYWVRETDIDGFRCDVAGFVPTDFWETARAELDAIKPVFMLAEWESKDLHAAAFDMTYSWHWNDTVHRICQGLLPTSALEVYYAWNDKHWPRESMRMLFVSNHDKNALEGTEFEQFSDGLEAAMVLSVISEGMPLIHNGQEAGYDKRLEFFERDAIVWREHPYADLYRRLFALKHANTALWNAPWGPRMVRVPNSDSARVFSFVRCNEQDAVFAVFNFSSEPVSARFRESLYHGAYADFATGEGVNLSGDLAIELAPWAYRVFVK
jgi:1,4-alpha-glucan branching enzyme